MSVTEELLLRRAQCGDHHAERLLIELHEPLARQICKGFFLDNGDRADLMQAARIGLWQAIHGWDRLRGSRFRPFAALVMRREVMMLVTASRARNQVLLNGACSLDGDASPRNGSDGLSLSEMLAAPVRDASDPAEVTLARERLQLILAALPALSEHERGSLSMTLNGLSQTEIGTAFGAGAKSVNNALQRARRKRQLGVNLRGRLSICYAASEIAWPGVVGLPASRCGIHSVLVSRFRWRMRLTWRIGSGGMCAGRMSDLAPSFLRRAPQTLGISLGLEKLSASIERPVSGHRYVAWRVRFGLI